MTRPTARRAAALLVAMVAALVGCGVPADDEAIVEDPDEVPFQLLDQPAQAPPPPASVTTTVDVYLVAPDDTLEPVTRQIESRELIEVVRTLLDGPTEEEQEVGLRSDLTGTDVRDVTLAGGVAAVDLDADFASLRGARQLTAIGQLVATLTARPGVGRVAFALDGEDVEVPRGDGALTSGSVSRDAYRELIDPE
jgi:spore germination protein GerM